MLLTEKMLLRREKSNSKCISADIGTRETVAWRKTIHDFKGIHKQNTEHRRPQQCFVLLHYRPAIHGKSAILHPISRISMPYFIHLQPVFAVIEQLKPLRFLVFIPHLRETNHGARISHAKTRVRCNNAALIQAIGRLKKGLGGRV